MNQKKLKEYYHNAYIVTTVVEKASTVVGFIAAIVLLGIAGFVENGGTLTFSKYVIIAISILTILACAYLNHKSHWARRFHASMWRSL